MIGSRGQADTLEAFVAARGGDLMRLAYLLTGSQHEAEDLWQDTFADVHRHWRRVAAADHPYGYVRSMMAHRHTSRRRRRWWGEQPADPATMAPPSAPDHADRIAAADALWATLATLAPRARAVLVLRYLEDLSDPQIAEALGISRSTVAATASRALTTLRDRGDLR